MKSFDRFLEERGILYPNFLTEEELEHLAQLFLDTVEEN